MTSQFLPSTNLSMTDGGSLTFVLTIEIAAATTRLNRAPVDTKLMIELCNICLITL